MSITREKEHSILLTIKSLQFDKVCLQFESFVKLLCDAQKLEFATSTTERAMICGLHCVFAHVEYIMYYYVIFGILVCPL